AVRLCDPRLVWASGGQPRAYNQKVSDPRRSCPGICPLDRQIGFDGDIDGIAGVALPERVIESNDVRGGSCKRSGKRALKCLIRRVVRPQREHAAGTQMRGELGKPRRRVQRGVAWMQEAAWRVIDIDQHRVEAAA